MRQAPHPRWHVGRVHSVTGLDAAASVGAGATARRPTPAKQSQGRNEEEQEEEEEEAKKEKGQEPAQSGVVPAAPAEWCQ